MKKSILILSSTLFAAAGTLSALADATPVSKDSGNPTRAIVTSSERYAASADYSVSDHGFMEICTNAAGGVLGTMGGTVGFSSGTTVAGMGTLEIFYKSGGATYTIDLTNVDFSGFAGAVTVTNNYNNRGATTKLLGNCSGVEYVMGSAASLNGSSNTYGLQIAGDTTLAGVTSGANSDTITAASENKTLTLAGAGTYSFSGTVGSDGRTVTRLSLDQTGSGTQTFGGTNWLQNVTLSSGSGSLVLAGTTNIAGTVTNAGQLTVSGNATFSSTITNTGWLDLSGANNVSLASAITNSGMVIVSDSMVIDFTGEKVDNVYTLINGGTVEGFGNLTISNITLSGSALTSRHEIVQTDGQGLKVSETSLDLTWSGDNGTWANASEGNKSWKKSDASSTFFIDGDSVTFNTNGATVTVDGAVNPNQLTISDNTTFTGTGSVNVATGVIADGKTLTTGVDSSFASITNNGTLKITAGTTTFATLPTGTIVVDTNGTLDLGSSNTAVTVNTVSGAGTVKLINSYDGHTTTLNLGSDFTGTVDYTGKIGAGNLASSPKVSKLVLSTTPGASSTSSIWYNGAYTIDPDVHFKTNYQIGDNGWSNNGGVKLTFSGNISAESGTTVTVSRKGYSNNAVAATFSGSNVQFYTLSVADSGTIVNFSNNSGTTTITTLNATGGTMNVNSGMTIGTFNASSGTFTLGGNGNITIGRFNGCSAVSTNQTLTIAAEASVSVNSGFDFRYEYAGTSTMNLSGELSVNGTLKIARDGNGIININDGGTLTVSGLGFGQNWGGSKSSIVNLAGTLVVGGEGIIKSYSNINTSALNLKGGVLGTSAESMTIAAEIPVVLGTDTTSTINTARYAGDSFSGAASTITMNSVISGAGSLTKNGAGTLKLSAANTFTGATTISAGTLEISNASVLSNSSGVTIEQNGTLSLGVETASVASLAGTGTLSKTAEIGTATLTATSSSFSGTIDSGVKLIADSISGTLDLGVDAGATLNVNALADGASVTLTSVAGTVNVSSGASVKIGTNSITGTITATDTGSQVVLTGTITTAGENAITLSDNAKILVSGTLGDYSALDGEENVLKIIAKSAIQYNDPAAAGIMSLSLDTDDSILDALVLDSSLNSYTLGVADGWVVLSIPEPSAFGLLAGLGALALAGTRRRRKSK